MTRKDRHGGVWKPNEEGAFINLYAPEKVPDPPAVPAVNPTMHVVDSTRRNTELRIDAVFGIVKKRSLQEAKKHRTGRPGYKEFLESLAIFVRYSLFDDGKDTALFLRNLRNQLAEPVFRRVFVDFFDKTLVTLPKTGEGLPTSNHTHFPLVTEWIIVCNEEEDLDLLANTGEIKVSDGKRKFQISLRTILRFNLK